MRRHILWIGVFLGLVCPAALAAEGALVKIRGTLNGDAARALEVEIRDALEGGADVVLLDFDVDGAPESGLPLADAIANLGEGGRISAVVTGRAPGSATAAVLRCAKIYMTDGSSLGPIPDRGRVRTAVAAAFTDRDLPRNALPELYPKPDVAGGIDAASAESLRLADRVVLDRTEVFRILGLEPPPPTEEPDGGSPRGRRRVTGTFERPFLIPFEGQIDDTLAGSVKRRVAEAKAAGADLLIFEMDSPGGLVSSSMTIGDLVFELKIPTVMLILKEAYSGAALVALAGDEIVMSANGVLGDCQPIAIGPGGYTVIGEKIQSPLRALFRKYAEASGYPATLSESMITQEMQVERATFADGTVLYIEPGDLERLEETHGKAVSVETVVAEDKLLTMHGREARDLGFAGELVTSRPDALARFGLEEDDLTILEETWAEKASRWLLSIKFLLFFVGLIAAWMELKAPGFGLPGAIAIIAFALFFSASWISGITTGLEVVLFLLGMALLVVEVFVIPGFGVPGILGVILIVVSLYMASVSYGLPSPGRPWETRGLRDWALSFGATMVAVIAGVFAVAKYLPKTSIGRKLILAPAGPEGSLGLTGSGSTVSERSRFLEGKAGVALSTLRPSGRIEVEGEPYNAVTEGDWIEAGDDVVVSDVSGNRILVRKA